MQLPKTHGADPDNFAWSATGLHTEKLRSWGLVSAAIINRAAGEATALSNHHRVAVSLTAIEAPLVLCTGQVTLRTGLSKVGVPGASVGLQAREATIASVIGLPPSSPSFFFG